MAELGYRQLDPILQRVLELPDELREAFLDETCGAQSELRRMVERMLGACDADNPELRPGGAMAGALWKDLCLRHAPGQPGSAERVGVYRIVETVGHGGMATVYRAERADGQFEQTVALKILHPSGHAEEVARRFAQERQILASLDHPHIARLIDGGMTASGQPFVAMEYIDGRRIDTWCEESRLPVDQRVELFLDVAAAVDYAHRNLIIHRDIKPSNILVTPEGSAKLLDFGIAKLLDASLPHSAPETRSALRPMTPQYASPEQVRGEPLTTAADVYQLGYLLYQLMTCREPYRVEQRNYAEVVDAICCRDPERPSAAVLELPAGAEAVAPDADEARRRRRALEGDLDNIVLKALGKDPVLRYASAGALADDLRRYLDGRPVTARRASAAYRVRKFVRRNRVAVAASALAALLLAGGVAAYTVQVTRERNRAEVQTAKALQVTDFLMRLFEAADPQDSSGPVTARALLDRGVQQVESLDAQPAVQAQMLDVVGQVYRHLGDYDSAKELLQRAVSMRQAAPDGGNGELAESLVHLGQVLDNSGDYAGAIDLYRQALGMQRARLGEENLAVAGSMNALGLSLAALGRYGEAEPLYRQSLAMRRKLLGEEHPDVATSLNNLGLLLWRTGHYEEAEAMHRQALAMRRKLLGDDHLDVTYSLNNLALVLEARGDFAAAEPLYRELLALDRKILGPEHPEVAMDMNNLGTFLLGQGRYDEAVALLRQALAMRRKLLGDRHPLIAQSVQNLAASYDEIGDYERAEPLYREALAIDREALGEEHPVVAAIMRNLANLLGRRGDYAAAEPLERRALAIFRATLGEQHPDVAWTLMNLGTLLARKGDLESAAALQRQAVDIQAAATAPDNPTTARIKSALGETLTKTGDYEEAEALLLDAYAILRAARGSEHRHTEEARQRLAALYEARGNREKAAEYRAHP